jgi:hypothetical protein
MSLTDLRPTAAEGWPQLAASVAVSPRRKSDEARFCYSVAHRRAPCGRRRLLDRMGRENIRKNKDLDVSTMAPTAVRSGSMLRLTLPKSLSDRLEPIFRASKLQPGQLSRVKRLGKAHEPIDHDTDGLAFAYLYFGANFAKTYLAADALPKRRHPLRVLDLGTGSGASICGLVQRCLDEGIVLGHLGLVDLRESQLSLFRRVAQPWLREVAPNLEITIANTDAVDRLATDRLFWDAISTSYLFCELGEANRARLRSLLAARHAAGTSCIIVDSVGPETAVLDAARGDWRPLNAGPFEIELPYLRSTAFGELPRYSIEEAREAQVFGLSPSGRPQSAGSSTVLDDAPPVVVEVP